MLRDSGKKTSYIIIIIIIIIILKNVLDQNRTPFVKCMSSNFCLKTVSWSLEIEDFTLFDCSFASTYFLLEVSQTIWENNKLNPKPNNLK
jgi:hypothetical protein